MKGWHFVLPALLGLVVFFIGAAYADVANSDMAGVWRSVDGGSRPVTIYLYKNGTFVRDYFFEDIEMKVGGTYTYDKENINFNYEISKVQQFGPYRAQESRARTPYKIDGMIMILNPGTKLEQRFMLLA